MSKETIYYIIIGAVYLYFQYAKWKKANPGNSTPKPKPVKEKPIVERTSTSVNSTTPKPKKQYLPRQEEKRPIYERLEDTQFTYDSPTLIRAANEKQVENVSSSSYNAQKALPLEQRKFMFSEFTTEKKPNPYAEKLKNPNSVKEAFIFAEILNKKYN